MVGVTGLEPGVSTVSFRAMTSVNPARQDCPLDSFATFTPVDLLLPMLCFG